MICKTWGFVISYAIIALVPCFAAAKGTKVAVVKIARRNDLTNGYA